MTLEEVVRGEVVELLREVTQNRNAALANIGREAADISMREDLRLTREAMPEVSHRYRPVLRPIESAGLQALARVYDMTFDCDEVARVIEEADAGWLYPVVIERALETLVEEGTA